MFTWLDWKSMHINCIPNTALERVVYLGNQTQAIAVLEYSDYPSKERMLSQVREVAPATGKNKGKPGRPRKIEISGTVLSLPRQLPF